MLWLEQMMIQQGHELGETCKADAMVFLVDLVSPFEVDWSQGQPPRISTYPEFSTP